jgi:hypothetical protein
VSNKLPSVTSDIPRDLRTFIDRLREVISSSGTDRFVTAQDLINGGLASVGTTGTLIPIKKGVIATPPAPQNLSATGSVNAIFLEWDNPTYFGHDYTEVYSGGTNLIGDAVLLGFTPGVNYVDTIGPQQSRYYWIRFKNTEGTAGPFNAVGGTLGQTGIEVEHMLEVLTGAVTESQLYQDLGARINLVDGPASLAGSVAARIKTEADARTAAILAESNTRATAILAEATARGAAITAEATTRQTADSSLASQITTVTASVASNAAAIQTEATARADADSAEATARQALAARVTNAETGLTAAQAAITTEATTRTTADTALATQITTLNSTVNNPTTGLAATNAAIVSEATTRAAADTATAQQLTTLESTVNNPTTGLAATKATLTNFTTTQAGINTSTAQQLTTLESTVNNPTTGLAATKAALTSFSNAQTTLNTATAQSISGLTTTVGGQTTSIQANTESINGISGKYTVKIDNNGYVSGFGLASEPNNGTPFSSFVIRADRFSISSPNGPGISPVTPFIVTTTPQTIDGTNVPAGVYIDGAYIKGGSIDGSKITGGTITGTKLIDVSANKITGAALQATSFIESAAYIPGTQGWKIHANGTAEFAAASIRGQLTAGQINTNGLIIRDTNGTPIFGSGYPITYSSISGTPTLGPLATASSISYTNVTGLGTLATQNSVSASNVSGLGTLATQSSVNWNTQISNVPGFGGFAFLSTITSANISTYIAGTAIGTAYIADAAITGAKILDGEVTNAKIGGAIQSTNYYPGYSGWKIDKGGSAEFNDITVRSGQITGALQTVYKINSYVGLYVRISGAYPISVTNGPYYLNGDTSVPQYLVYSNYMPAPATAAHKIFVSVNVQALGVSVTRDLAVLILINAYFYGGNYVTATEQIAYNTNSGTFGIATNATGVTTNTYATSVPVMIFVGGYNAEYTIQTIDGMAMGVR